MGCSATGAGQRGHGGLWSSNLPQGSSGEVPGQHAAAISVDIASVLGTDLACVIRAEAEL